jgi:outer membrane protein assembly factor BamA
VGGNAGYMETGIGPGEDEEYRSLEQVFDESQAPGLSDAPAYRTAGGVLQLDSRSAVSTPERGAVVAFQAQRYDDPDDRFSFTRIGLDARAFVPLGSPQRVLAMRGYAQRDTADAGQRVPFFMQQPLGGSHSLRGFQSFRFRGERVLLLQAEYRWFAVPALEFGVFVDSGVVASPGQSLDLHELRTNWGAGIRFKAPKSFLMRLEWARSPEDHRFYVRFSPGW